MRNETGQPGAETFPEGTGNRRTAGGGGRREKGTVKTEFLWLYVSLGAVLVLLVAFLLIPSVRKRIEERLDIIFSIGARKEISAPVPPTLPLLATPSTTIPPETKKADSSPDPLSAPRKDVRPSQSAGKPRLAPLAREPVQDQESADQAADSSPPTEPGRGRATPPRLGRAVGSGGSRGAGSADSPRPPAGESASKAEPAITALSQSAYKILLDKVPSMAALQGSTLNGFQFTSWKAVKEEEPEVWIAVLARRTDDNQEESFIWKVNTSDMTVSPLSQAARRAAAQK